MAGKQQIDIGQLPIQQLNALTQQFQEEIEFFTNSLNQLKLAQSKYVESQESLNKVCPESKDKEILVPLTSSMYVPGQLSDVDNVLVDIGTGYYVDMGVNAAKEYFKRRIDFLTKQIEKIQPVLQEKYKMKQVTTEILQMKIAAQLQAQQSAKT
ncbi:prefoldin subunit 5-like [Ruditapes philippinarum]|uniref:prefoldin subunit 5-like n=1 Tax=Ruditapes philippinarum TaxID=129788 RepID=UPI00295B40DF|nr:prefoldin subunit 5-like [Ruditapes philippinarum]